MRPVPLETWETPRIAGTCYRFADWIQLGRTEGRGKLDPRQECAKPIKNMFSFDQVLIDEVEIDPGRRHDTPAVRKRVYELYSKVPLRQRVFAIVEKHLLESVTCADNQEWAFAAKLNPAFGRPGIHLWIVLALALRAHGISRTSAHGRRGLPSMTAR